MRIAKTLKTFLVWLKIMNEQEEEKIMKEKETLKMMTEEEEIMEEETPKIMTEEKEIMEEQTLKIMTEGEEITEEETLKIMTEEEEEVIIMEMWTTPILLPHEIHIEILSWIPAKSLISSFKLVCKSWRNLIKDPDFIKMHLNRGGGRSSSRSNNESLVRKSKSGNAIYQLHPPFNFNFDDEEGLLNPIIAEAKKMDIDSSLLELKPRLVGSCNGLLCLSVVHDERIILLNPSTRKYRASPKQLFDIPISIFSKPVTYGFNCFYNSTTGIDEYKVVRIAYYYPFGDDDDGGDHSFEFQIDIYSMSTNSWRRWRNVKEEDVVPYEMSLHQSGAFVNGAFHWMGCKRRSGYIWDTIVSFNIIDEEFGRQVPVPPPCEIEIVDAYGVEYPYIKNDVVLINVRGYLGNVYFDNVEVMDIDLEIWVMKEYGIKESWTKQFVIRSYDSYTPSELFGSSIYSTSRSCFFTGDQILLEGRVFFGSKGDSMRKGKGYGRLVLYDMNKKKIVGQFSMVDIPCVPQDDQVDYIETLVSLESSVFPLSDNQKRKDMESLRNQIFDTGDSDE